MEFNKKKLRYIFLGAGACILLYWMLHETERVSAICNSIYTVLAPFLAGAVLAFVLNVPMRAVEKLLHGIDHPGLRRGTAILVTMLAVMLVLAGVVCLLVPQITQTAETLIAELPDFFRRLKALAVDFLADHPELKELLVSYTDFESINWSEWIQKVIEWLSGSLTSLLDGAFGAIISLSTGIFNAIVSVVFALYCLSRKEILARQALRITYSILPEKAADETVRVLRMTNATFSKFISGQCLEAVILGCLFAVSMTIFRMPFVPLVSVVIAVTALVPIVGAFVGCVLGAFFILVQDPMLAVWFVVLFLVLQQIENNMIYPRVVGTSIGLPGMWVLVAVAVGGDLMGVGGMLIMIPLASVLYALLKEFTNKRLAQLGIPEEKLRDRPQEQRRSRRKKRREGRGTQRKRGK